MSDERSLAARVRRRVGGGSGGVLRLLLLRGAGIALGFGATVAFFSLAGRELGRPGFAALIVAMNCTLVVQTFDLGVGSRYITTLAQGLSTPGRFQAGGFAFLNAVVGAATSLVAFLVYCLTLATTDSVSGTSLLVGVVCLAGAWFASTFATRLGTLVGISALVPYYAFALLQPVVLVVATSVLYVVRPGDLAYAAAFACSVAAPTVAAMVYCRTLDAVGFGRVRDRAGMIQLLRRSAPIGASQVAGTVTYVGLPTLIALSGSLTVVAAYGLLMRIYASMWSLAGTVHVGNWADLAEAARAGGDPEAAVRRRVNRTGVVLGSALAAGLLALWGGLRLADQPDLLPSATVTGLVALAVLVRAAFIGEVLTLSVRGPARPLLVGQWTIAGLTLGAVVLLGGLLHAPAAVLCAATVLDGLAMTWWNRRPGRSTRVREPA